MSNRPFDKTKRPLYILLAVVLFLSVSCNSTKYLGERQYLLRKNKVVLTSDKPMTNKGEVRDYLAKNIVQKPNTNSYDILPFRLPLKLWRYNRRYAKWHDKPDTSLPKSLERPVIVDTALTLRSIQNMKNYMFYHGYFYSRIKDSMVVKHKKAFVTYYVDAGKNYEINTVTYKVEDSAIAQIVRSATEESGLQKGVEFNYTLLEEERSRVTQLVRNAGYYRFTQENVNFNDGLDTVDKTIFKNAESPFENAMNFIAPANKKTKNTIDITVNVQMADDSLAYTKYIVNSVNVYPDYTGPNDLKDSTMRESEIKGVNFRIHQEYVHPRVLYEHIYLSPGAYFSEKNFNKTYSKLNELGIFQYIRIQPRENRRNRGIIDYDIILNKTKKYDFVPTTEMTSGSTYAFGVSGGLNFRDRNFFRGANLLTIGVNGGVELSYNDNKGFDFLSHFGLLTRYYGVNGSIDFPKFIAPVASSLFDNSNLPHTIIGGGKNVMERVNYFQLINNSVNFSYSWRETDTKTWSLSPAFMNIIRVPLDKQSDSFKRVLLNNTYLRNSYSETFIEGENISFTFDNMIAKHSVNYSFIKVGFEEAGGILSGLNKTGVVVNELFRIKYAQYTKFDFDARHYFTINHSVVAVRFYGGIGLPSGQSSTLPYIKQYFAGGPYSLRGWRIRTLGPGSYLDTNRKDANNINQLDRTGDVKLEMNGEYRFPIAPLFAGAVKMKGAVFADAGNIWLAKSDTNYVGGEFKFSKLGQDIAMDVGAGARFEIASFLTLRVDVAMPVKKPYIHTNYGWVFDEIDIYNSTWRANNIIFNISIGYPF